MSGPIKVCGCGRSYDHREWLRLPHVGVSDLGGDRLDMRNCSCGSSICVELPPGISVCIVCTRWIGEAAGEIKVCAESVFCEACAVRGGVVRNLVRRTAA